MAVVGCRRAHLRRDRPQGWPVPRTQARACLPAEAAAGLLWAAVAQAHLALVQAGDDPKDRYLFIAMPHVGVQEDGAPLVLLCMHVS